MGQIVSGDQDFEVDIEAGRSNVIQESTSDIERLDFRVSEKISDDLIYPLMGNKNPPETISKSLDFSEKKCDNVKYKKSRKASKPPRPPKGPSLSLNDHKVRKEIAELAMRKRERIERMKRSLRRIKAAKSSSSASTFIKIFSMIVTVLFFGFLLFQGIFAGNSNLRTEEALAPNVAPSNRLISVQFYNEFEQIDRSPTTSYSRGD